MSLFPRNVPLTVRYATALLETESPKKAHAILLDLYNQVPPTPVPQPKPFWTYAARR